MGRAPSIVDPGAFYGSPQEVLSTGPGDLAQLPPRGENYRPLAPLLCALAAGANAGAVELTAENWPDVVENSGKNAFVKFLAPW